MSAAASEAVRQITYSSGALKAPRITEADERLADQARDAAWSFEDYLATVLEREVSARNASGAELRIRARCSPPARPSRASAGTHNRPVGSRSRFSPPPGSPPKRARRAPRIARHREDPPGHQPGHHRGPHPERRQPPPPPTPAPRGIKCDDSRQRMALNTTIALQLNNSRRPYIRHQR